MSDWRELIAAKDWEQLDNFWFNQPPEVCAEILEALQQVVPLMVRINGMERDLDFAEAR